MFKSHSILFKTQLWSETVSYNEWCWMKFYYVSKFFDTKDSKDTGGTRRMLFFWMRARRVPLFKPKYKQGASPSRNCLGKLCYSTTSNKYFYFASCRLLLPNTKRLDIHTLFVEEDLAHNLSYRRRKCWAETTYNTFLDFR